MSRVQLMGGFALIPEGTHVFRIYDIYHNEEFGRIEVKMVTASGMTHTERFTIKNRDETPNEGALKAFSFFARTATGDFASDDIEVEDLIGHYIRAEVIHNKVPSTKEPGKTTTFANLGDKWPAEYFDTEPVPRALSLGRASVEERTSVPVEQTEPVTQGQPQTGLDLDALLG